MSVKPWIGLTLALASFCGLLLKLLVDDLLGWRR